LDDASVRVRHKAGTGIVLGIDITREGFDWALKNSVLSSFSPAVHTSPDDWKSLLAVNPVRIQWDPERDWKLNIVTGVRAIQIGLAGEAVARYVNQWIVHIEDLTPVARMIGSLAKNGGGPTNLPSESEHPYPLDAATAKAICAYNPVHTAD
jgi:hypothetical protein